MELLTPSLPEVWFQKPGFGGMCDHIARCAAICYDSEPKTGEDAEIFVRRLIKMGHGRALEFGTVFLNYDPELYPDYEKYIRSGNRDVKMRISDDDKIHITLNLRTWMNGERTTERLDLLKGFWMERTDHPLRATIYYPCISRGIADEFRTHTTLSTLMQSTRYVNKNKEYGVQFVLPYWAREMKRCGLDISILEDALAKIDEAYKKLIESGRLRQEAREVLPLCVSTEMVQCGFVGYDDEGWDNFLRLRTAKDAHPDAIKIAKLVKVCMDDFQRIAKFYSNKEAK